MIANVYMFSIFSIKGIYIRQDLSFYFCGYPKFMLTSIVEANIQIYKQMFKIHHDPFVLLCNNLSHFKIQIFWIFVV